MVKRMKGKLLIAVLVVLAVVIGVMLWYKLYRVVPQPGWITSDQRNNFLYGSVAAQEVDGIPYWIWLSMPRMFPEYMPKPGGYAALGLSWEESIEMPAGFAKQRIGYIRVTGNCALCHATSTRSAPDQVPAVVPAVPGHLTDIQPLLTFFTRCAQDPRFNADEFLSQVDTWTTMSLLDRLLFRYVLVPRTRKALTDPAPVILAPELLLHSRDPKSEAPFSTEQMKALREWMKANQRSATGSQ
jgi:hypothetical protein